MKQKKMYPNDEGAKGYRDAVIADIDVSDDIVYEEFPKKSAFDVETATQDPETPRYVENEESGKAYGADTPAPSELSKDGINRKFSIEHDVPESAKVQGQKTAKMELQQETDSPADDSETAE